MVYRRFSWPYGGSEVFLFGSFNGWTNRIRMNPVEGSNSIFMIVCDVPPGYHQYKFLVNGVWRIDNQQSCVQDPSGDVNNLIHVEISDSTSSRFHTGIYGPNMMLDNIAGTQHSKIELQLLDTDKDVFQRNIFMHLSSQKVFQLMPESGKVFALDDEVTIKDAFLIMHEQGLYSVPIMDGYRGQISGMLTASDFILILIELNRNRAMLTDEQVGLRSISTWKREKSRFYEGEAAAASELMMFRKTLIQATPDESVKDLALKLLQNKISSLPIVHSMSDGSCPQLLHVACLGGILKYICTQFRSNLNFLPVLRRPIGSLHLGTWISKIGDASSQLLTVHHTDVLGSALNLLLKAQVSSLPIVNSDGSLVNVYSRSDIMSLAKNDAYVRVQLDGTILTQALELVDGQRYCTCTRSDPLSAAMERLSNPGVRRLVVVEAGTNRVEGIITLRDVFTFLLG